MKFIINPILLLVLLCGCESMSVRDVFFDGDANVIGVGSNIEAAFEEINLVRLLDPEKKGIYSASDPDEELSKSEKIDIAFHTFVKEYPRSTLKQRRNAVQEHILASSTQRCNYFKHKLQYKRGMTNFSFGTLATIAGAAGAVVTGVDGSRILSAASAIFSGVRAEYNQELFANLATQIIVGGIDLRRREVYEQIVLEGQRKRYSSYNIEASVKDAIYYHGLCNVVVGLEVAGDTVQQAEDPGIDKVNQILAKISITKKLLQNDELSPTEKIKVLVGATSLLSAGTPVKDESPSDPLVALTDGNLDVSNQASMIMTEITKIDIQKLTLAQKQSMIKNIKSAQTHALSELKKCQNSAMVTTQAIENANVKNRSLMVSLEVDSVAAAGVKFDQDLANANADIVIAEIERIVIVFKELLSNANKLIDKEKPVQSDVNSANSKIKSINTSLKHNSKMCK